MADLRALVEAVRPFADEVRERSCQPHYGYPVVENPHDFDPDRECCTPEEIANHKAACEAWDRGERDVRPTTCGNLASNGWGIGAQTIRDPALSAVADLLDALLTSRAVEAVEVLRRLGTARAKRLGLANAIVNSAEEYRANQAAWERADEAVWDAMREISKLADALAKKED